MSSIPSNLARVPNIMAADVILGSLTRTSRDLLNTQIQLATGLAVNRPSDDSVAASAISFLDDIIEQRDQRKRNLSHADSVLGNVDQALGDATNILQEAKGIGLSQVGVGSDQQTRENQGAVIDAMLREMINIANRKYQQIHFFGGDATAGQPIVDLLGGVQYVGQGDGLTTDLGSVAELPITISAEDAFGTLSSRVEGDRDLDPIMTGATRLSTLNGARGFGVTPGSINVDIGGTDITVDLSDAHTVQDVIDTLQTEIQTIDAGATVTIDTSGNAFNIEPTAATITISDLSADSVAADLGLTGTYPVVVGGTAGSDVDPFIVPETPITSLQDGGGLPLALGVIRISNGGQTRDIDLSTATTVEDIQNAVKGVQIGVRVEISESGDRLNFVNELSGGLMSIAEVSGGTTASDLGVRSFTTSTLLSDFNNGLGVQIKSGSVDPVSGLPDPTADEDVRITTADGTTFNVDFAGATTVQDILDDINAASGGAVTAALAVDGNGIELTDNTVGAGAFMVETINGSFAGEDLGILGSTTGATLTGQDRATVAVDSVFAHLIALRDALLTNDERGIQLATGKLDGDIERVSQVRGIVGVRSRRVADALNREELLRIQDMSIRSEFRDLDFAQAATRFAQLQQQLQAGLASASRITSLSLLDFIG